VEVTWVVSDFIGSGVTGSKELTVHKGQQVEVVEIGETMCLVRMLGGTPEQPGAEGLVPLSVLKQVPHGRLGGAAESTTNNGRDMY